MKGILTCIIRFAKLVLPLTFTLTAFAQTDTNNRSEQSTGTSKRADLQKGVFSNYFFKEYSDYTPSKEATDLLENKIFSYSITVVLGTWCGDSKEQVPRFIKILDVLDYNTNLLEIICVDRKKSAGMDISSLKIERVPTFIFFKEGIEIGRITESPLITLEEDIIRLLNK
jgi:hypothetical protein